MAPTPASPRHSPRASPSTASHSQPCVDPSNPNRAAPRLSAGGSLSSPTSSNDPSNCRQNRQALRGSLFPEHLSSRRSSDRNDRTTSLQASDPESLSVHSPPRLHSTDCRVKNAQSRSQ